MKCSNPPCKTNNAVCPDEYPFALRGGQSCCSSPLEKEKAYFPEDGRSCFGRIMSWESSCCKDDFPYTCKNPPCRDASVANQAKVDYYYEHLPVDEYDKFFEEEVFLVKKGWHVVHYIDESSNRRKRDVNTEISSSKKQEKKKINNLVAAVKSGIVRHRLDDEEMLFVAHQDGVVHETAQKDISDKIGLAKNKTNQLEQNSLFASQNDTNSSYDTITALRKALGDTYKCKLEKCKKYSNDFAKGSRVGAPFCINPPCTYQGSLNRNDEKILSKMSIDKMVEDHSTNVFMTPPPQNSKFNIWDPTFLFFIIIGIVFVTCVCFCGFCCVAREMSRYSANKEQQKEKNQKKEDFYLTHKDNYLEREQRMQKERIVNSTVTTFLNSGDEGFGSRFDFHKDVPPPDNPMLLNKPMMAYNNDGKRIMRSSTLKPHVRGSHYNVHTLGRGSGVQKLYQDFYRSNQGLHKLTIDKRCQSEYIINGTGTHRPKKGHLVKDSQIDKHRVLRRPSIVDDVHYEQFTRTLQKSDRRRFQSSSNLDSEGHQEQSSTQSDVTSSPSTLIKNDGRLGNVIESVKNEPNQIVQSVSSPDNTTYSEPSKYEERKMPPLPPIPAKKPSVIELRQRAAELKQVFSKDNRNIPQK